MTVKGLKGFWLEGDSAKQAWNGSVSVLLKDKPYRFALSNDYYLIDDTFCYGVIKLKGINKLPPSEFSELFDKHKVDNKERVARWKTAHKTIYMYNFELVKRFDKPYNILNPSHSSPFINNFLLLEEVSSNDIPLKDEYIVKTLSDSSLKSGWGNVLEWCSEFNDGKRVPYENKSIINLMHQLFDELVSRGLEFKLSDVPINCRATFHDISNNISHDVTLLNRQLTLSQNEVEAIKYYDDVDQLSSLLFGSDTEC